MANQRICTIPACGKQTRTMGLCNAHYLRKLRYGNAMDGGTDINAARAFLEEALRWTDLDQCLIWPFSSDRKGYAQANIKGVTSSVSRYVCETVHGPAPEANLGALHRCGNGRGGCINPLHLYWGCQKQNMLDADNHGTLVKGELTHSAKLTESDVREIRNLKGKLTQSAISRMFGVSHTTIRDIHVGKKWSWLR